MTALSFSVNYRVSKKYFQDEIAEDYKILLMNDTMATSLNFEYFIIVGRRRLQSQSFITLVKTNLVFDTPELAVLATSKLSAYMFDLSFGSRYRS